MAAARSQTRLASWVDLVGDLLQQPRADLPLREVVDALGDTFGALGTWHWRDPDGSFGFGSPEVIERFPVHEMEYWGREGLVRHPLVRWFAVSGDLSATTVGRVPETVSPAADRQLLREQLRPIGHDEQLALPYRMNGYVYRGFVVSRTGDDFDDDDVELARRVQVLLTLLARQVTVVADHDRLPSAREAGLTGREHAVLQLLAQGLTSTAMARRLGISARTVEAHLAHLYRKLGVNDRLVAVEVGRQAGLLGAVPPSLPPGHGFAQAQEWRPEASN
ncbi:MAG: helix-turn-helix transcriptional regulator [Nocardioidaceae bacterium]|nr:helix-turn-helix transcriptional regulator [Nocardioidaceae bacterium]